MICNQLLRRALGAFVGLVFASTAMAQTTWIVDAAGGGQFTTIDAAHDAASPGDTLLVRPGSYAGLFRDPVKGVRILGAAPGVVVTGPVVLHNLPSAQQLTIERLGIDAASNPFVGSQPYFQALHLERCGNVVLTDLVVRGPFMGSICPCEGGTGISLYWSVAAFANVDARGGDGVGWTQSSRGGAGCLVHFSTVVFSSCRFEAGTSGASSVGGTARTNASLLCVDSQLSVDECSLPGGTPAGSSMVALRSRVLIANHAGPAQNVALTTPTGSIEFDGAVQGVGSPYPLTPRPQPGLVGPSTVARGGTLTWTVRGGPGNTFLSAISLGLQPSVVPGLSPTLFVPGHPTAVLLGVGTIGASGDASPSFVVPNWPALVNMQVFLQVGGWLGQSSLKASGVAITTIV